MISIKVEKINVERAFDRTKVYTPEDITNQVAMPIIDVERLDASLDTSSLVLYNREEDAIVPFTKMIITLTNEKGEEEKIYRFVYRDTPELLVFGANKKYKHTVELIEPTKWLERFNVDNTTVTNLLAYLYQEDSYIFPLEEPFDRIKLEVNGVRFKGENYANETRLFDIYFKDAYPKINIRLNVVEKYKISYGPGILQQTVEEAIPLVEYRIIRPDGTVVDAMTFNDIALSQVGTYTFWQKYQSVHTSPQPPLGNFGMTAEYQWTVKVVEKTTDLPKYPTKYNLAQVTDLVLSKVGEETNILRNQIDTPLFSLETSIKSKLKEIISPEYTFSQNTLFGILSQIGDTLHAIPRLIPKKSTIIKEDGTQIIDDWSEWTVITFDFLGGDELAKQGKLSAIEHSYNGDNYTSSFVSNVENSFQTNNIDDISLVEPFDGGFVSTRTEDASFEVSNNSAIIKLSRPIQRISEVIVRVKHQNEIKDLDISKFVKESADYSILSDFSSAYDLHTKSTAIYYTRGDNKIKGLDYITEQKLSSFFVKNAINNIIGLKLSDTSQTFDLKDLMFRVKYVPYYSLKVKQYKPYINKYSGNNELYFNQQNAQMVDIESFGENMKGALLRTANEEITKTEYFKDFKNIIKTGQVTEDGYYAYQVNKEINPGNIKTTTTFSKNWNKWNEYLAIRKNYREWEISERESLETNPIYNEFCIISNKLDINQENLDRETELRYEHYLASIGGITSLKCMEIIQNWLLNDFSNKALPIRWVVGTTISEEYQTSGEYQKVKHRFLLPCSCFSLGNSVVLNFGAQDNYALSTFVENVQGKYALENNVKYTDKFGKIQNMELSFGYGEPFKDGFNTFENSLTNSKKLYNFDSELQNVVFDYRQNSFILNKDSRQKLDFTVQYNFVTDNENIFIGKAFCQDLPFVGTNERELRMVLFKHKPDKFLNEVDPSNYIDFNYRGYGTGYSKKYIWVMSSKVTEDCAGYGIVDDKNQILLYYNDKKKKGEMTEELYLMFRKRI